MRKEARRWLKQAEDDLKAAKDSLETENYNWSCFQSQQSAEKALKAYLYNLGYTSLISHSARILLKNCIKKESRFKDFEKEAKALDMYYIPTRYPNGLDTEITPSEYFTKEDAQECLKYATSILNAVKRYIKD